MLHSVGIAGYGACIKIAEREQIPVLTTNMDLGKIREALNKI